MQKSSQNDKGRSNRQNNKVQVAEIKGTLPVYYKVKKNSSSKIERSICGCQARLHPLVNNCLKCGRIVCLQEGPGPCFHCGHIVTKSGEPQIDPFNNDSNTEGYTKAKDSLDKLLMYDKTMAKRTTIFDDQNDYFDMNNKWMSEDEKSLLASKEQDKRKEKEKNVTYTIDLENRIVLEDTTVRCDMKQEDVTLNLIKEKEIETEALEQERQKKELFLRSQRNEDGSLHISPTLDVTPPKYVHESKKSANNKSSKTRKKVQHDYYQVEIVL